MSLFCIAPSLIILLPFCFTIPSNNLLTCLHPSTPTTSMPSRRLTWTRLSHTSTATLSLSPSVATVR
ncbi:hypothetical protein Trco_000085 [Trichoderma cornu-damae]|uniref:Translation elongation factor 1 alpha n=1 Tax=Trichoderma cornu-damae TaxID=654480 RepID=A0A9P8QUQ1_9HYPO|nr:hypothetical protein Trco_000085 [Trichoderma cornu-damae]